MNNFNADKFFNATGNDSLKFVNHNNTDYESFRKFQEDIDERYAKVERERVIKERSDNLRKWDQSLPQRWRGASLSKIDNPAAAEAAEIIKDKGRGCFFVKGDPGSGKTYISYAIIRKYIGSGWATFSQVNILTEETMLGHAYTGYKGRTRFEEILDNKYKIYLFDNVGMRENYDVSREVPMWERVIDHIYNNSLVAIFTSNNSASSFSNILSDSGQAKLSSLVAERVINVKGTRAPKLNDWDDKDQKRIDAIIDEENALNAFDD